MLYPKRMPPPPPPYSGSPSNGSDSPSMIHPSTMTPPASLEPLQLVDPFDMYSRSHSLPAQPEPVDPIVPASTYQFPSRVTASPPPLSSRSFATSSTFSYSQAYPLPPLPPLPPPKATAISLPTPRSRSLSATKPRSAFPFSKSKLSKATRNATAWFAEHATRKGPAEPMFEDGQGRRPTTADPATRIRTEEDTWEAMIQAKASEEVKSGIQSLLSRDLPNEEWNIVLQKCGQICANGGLDLSLVLQEPLIEGKPPVYWAILNRPATSLQNSDVDLHALVLSLLDICQPLKETTIASIRLACMLTSNNPLLQHLFWNFPALSPLTRSDAMLLGSAAGGGDIVDVDETHDGTGTFIARIQIRRFRLRMRVSKLVKVEFVTSGRPAQAFVQVAPKFTRRRSDLDGYIFRVYQKHGTRSTRKHVVAVDRTR